MSLEIFPVSDVDKDKANSLKDDSRTLEDSKHSGSAGSEISVCKSETKNVIEHLNFSFLILTCRLCPKFNRWRATVCFFFFY